MKGLLAISGVAALAFLLAPASAVADNSDTSGQVSVTATVAGVRVVVFDQDGQLDQVWTNTREADPIVRFRAGSPNGPDVVPSLKQFEAYRGVMLAIEPGVQPGKIWQRPEALSRE